jgi:hypothetical protein
MCSITVARRADGVKKRETPLRAFHALERT